MALNISLRTAVKGIIKRRIVNGNSTLKRFEKLGGIPRDNEIFVEEIVREILHSLYSVTWLPLFKIV